MTPPDRLHELLQSLPEPPEPDLWPRVLAARRRQRRQRRVVAGAASFGLAALLVVALWPRLQPPQPAVDAPAIVQATPDVDAQLRALDRALQVAYDRGASDDELAPLWEVRQALAAQLDGGGRPGSSI
ncbi:hypothetical protein [Pseudoxanthomonas sp. J35]|uniref:hypothetical protein n=1 Tax=Pseudoxanthomonas sp. J35 TaxID=935852 RepID=UPI000491C087|nr:hypothetical protein [Pseudoxanthomonas sp. J35]